MSEPTQTCQLCGRVEVVYPDGRGFPPDITKRKLKKLCNADGCPCEPKYRVGIGAGLLRVIAPGGVPGSAGNTEHTGDPVIAQVVGATEAEIPAEIDGIDVEAACEALTMLMCRWRLRIGICQNGCLDEPACETNEPDGGWATSLREATTLTVSIELPSICSRCNKPMRTCYWSTHWQGYVCPRCIQFTEDT